MTEERLELHEKAEIRINAIIDTLSQDKGGLADKLKQEDVKDFLVSLWVDCSTEVTKELQEELTKAKELLIRCEDKFGIFDAPLLEELQRFLKLRWVYD